MQLIVFSPESHFENEHNWLQQLFEAGLTHFHVRKPNWSEEEMTAYLKQIDSQYYSRIVLHDNYQLVGKFGLIGANWNARNDDGGNFMSASFHSFEEIEKEGNRFEYVFLSPIFDSISKIGYKAGFEKDQLKNFLEKKHSTKIIALGGIQEDRIDECSALEFDGVAVLGTIWKSKNPLNIFKRIQKKCQERELTY